MVFCYEMLTTPGKHECKKPPPPYPTGGTHNAITPGYNNSLTGFLVMSTPTWGAIICWGWGLLGGFT